VSSIDTSTKQINLKLVYYGPGLGGKTTSLQAIHDVVNPRVRGQLVSLATGSDRTLYFDFFPLQLPKIRGYAIKLNLYTVPGQVHYNSTRKLVLSGADGVVFVADSQAQRLTANCESMENLAENLREQGMSPDEVPLVIQYNKRDARDATPIAELERALNPRNVSTFETVATQQTGVFDALREITKLVIRRVCEGGAIDLAGAGQTPSAPLSERRPQTAPLHGPISPATEPQRDGVPLAISSFSDISQALARMEPSTAAGSGRPAMARPTPTGGMSDLVRDHTLHELAARAERCLGEGQWERVIDLVRQGLQRLTGKVSGTLVHGEQHGWALTALLIGMSADRYLEYEQLVRRVQQSGAVSREDALFSLFFLVDASLAWQRQQPPSAFESDQVEPH
jgi:mutual gliding-motility protein MglA